MALRGYPLRILLTTTLTSLLLLTLGASVAWLLYRQQSSKAQEVEENIGSRRAAAELETILSELIDSLRQGKGDVIPLHQRIRDQLEVIKRYADKGPEHSFCMQLESGFAEYLRKSQSRESPVKKDRLIQVLQGTMLPACLALRDFNAHQIEESGLVPEQTLRWMAWGLAAVGGFGSLAGLLLGYGLARGLSRTIHQFRIQVRDAADRLGQELPAVVLMSEPGDDPLTREAGELVRQVEKVVAKLQQREREVLRAERLAAVGQLAAGVAHEIRNPLTSIKMLIQAGREETEPGLSDEDLQVIEREIRRLERCLQTFLDFARPPRLERCRIDLVALAEQTLSLVRGRAEKQRVEVSLLRPVGSIEVEADGEQLQQVLVNLLLNALDVLPHGGRVTVQFRQANPEAIAVCVRDTGSGIAPEVLPRIFEPFTSSKETGVGLGLVVSRRIVEDHGGILIGRNLPEGGAEFLFTLPVQHGEPGGGKGEPGASAPGAGEPGASAPGAGEPGTSAPGANQPESALWNANSSHPWETNQEVAPDSGT